jgi:hypothetical protein
MARMMPRNIGENTGQPLQEPWSGLPKDEDQGCHQDSPAVQVRNFDAIRIAFSGRRTANNG